MWQDKQAEKEALRFPVRLVNTWLWVIFDLTCLQTSHIVQHSLENFSGCSSRIFDSLSPFTRARTACGHWALSWPSLVYTYR
ncbi:unnamed protein product [Pleuronectes platessa]|uniref:Uncharacterized protein n=1 Tax=Pleuronectes platessa TaxID=8262 RepID=A0A9N7V0S3_PLEPL|nr:unnamed protein product [Pleuronectes platessa]